LKGLVELRGRGVFASAVIKKRRYWPKYVPGNAMDEHMKTKQLGDTSSVKGQLDGTPYNLFMMRDKDWVMKMMSTYGGLVPHDDEGDARRWVLTNGKHECKKFKYTEPFSNHYKYRHAVDDHNNLRHSVPSIEGTWLTHRWPLRVLAFVLSVSEVNTYLALKYFLWKGNEIMTLHQFRRRLALALIHNEYIITTEGTGTTRMPSKRRKKMRVIHVLDSAPPHGRFFDGKKWNCTAKSRYQQYKCKQIGCLNKCRTFCACSPGQWICRVCHPVHITCEVTSDSSSN
jgi:hypothetical protein